MKIIKPNWIQCRIIVTQPLDSTKIQRLYQLGQFKQDQEAAASGKSLTAEELYQAFSAKLIVTAGETLSKTYVSLAVRLWDNVLGKKVLRDLLLLSDEVFGKKASAFNSIYKLEAFMQIAKNKQEHLQWLIQFAGDAMLNGTLRAQDMSVVNLAGNKASKGTLTCIQPNFQIKYLGWLGFS